MTVLRFEERSSSRTQNLVTACRDRKRSAKGGNGINSESSSGFMPRSRPCASEGRGYRLVRAEPSQRCSKRDSTERINHS